VPKITAKQNPFSSEANMTPDQEHFSNEPQNVRKSSFLNQSFLRAPGRRPEGVPSVIFPFLDCCLMAEEKTFGRFVAHSRSA